MKLVIVSIALALCSVSANPTPQFLGYQPVTPVGQWVSNNLQNSLQSVANAIQSITRVPSPNTQVVPVTNPNQIPNGPDNYGQGHTQTVVQPVPVQTIVQPYPSGGYAGGYQPGYYQPGPYQPGPYQPGPYQPGPYQPGTYQPGPYDQIHVIPVPPPNTPWQNGGVPYRNGQGEESKSSTWAPLPPLYYQFGEPSIVIISRQPPKPKPQNESATTEDLMIQENSTTMNPDAANTTTNVSQTEQTSTPTPGKKSELCF